ncbi:chitinase [Arthrobacter sp. CAN_A214]|uniref:chitinase n=1 Tax=Arthrobacter sp. CAN_A214 TaxID=2787720 RepID=UPI002FF0FFCE
MHRRAAHPGSPVLGAGGGMLAVSLALVGCAGHSSAQEVADAPWFAGYVDVTVPSTYEVDRPPTPEAAKAVLSFIVASEEDACEPSWGGTYSFDRAGTAFQLDDRLARLRNRGGEAVVSFGGQRGDELATTCTDPEELAGAYRSVLERYRVGTIDLDIEGDDLDDSSAGERRAEVIARLQRERDSGDPLQVWVTLPATPDGLTERGRVAVTQMLDADVELAGVNIMTMNYSSSRKAGQTMFEASVQAAEGTHRQLSDIYGRHGDALDAEQVWNRVGLTPMIGVNDVPGEVFDLAAAQALNEFAASRGIGRISLWSLNRDRACGPAESDAARPSNTCSGMNQAPGDFSGTLGAGFSGSIN